ncbi:hypothetical protein [Bordetella genomosp. 11]|uniref:Lipoprotein n=1 Tax=Bordetella genomosp. 11 TaxID=1416808 RepID=A0A261UK70_9BORD|nr:hypothetical protein [Bordetella genomosp. 11]OZI62294.1 hypothetical protein CAL28_24140 [Bordetella genomosp. 11]
MKSLTLRTAVAALALATAAGVASPAMAHGYYRGGGWHGGGWHGSSAGWWVGGALALGAAGAIIAANSAPAVVYTAPVYAAPPVVYGAPVYPAPVYAPPPVAYAAPPVYAPPPPAPSGNLIAYPARGQNQAQQTRDRSECQGWAMNQSGYDPAHPNQWTTGVMVDSYNRAMSACMTGRGYSVS